jgi:hypothetical protein
MDKEKTKIIAVYIRDSSAIGKLVSYDMLCKEPLKLEAKEIKDAKEEFLKNEEFNDIVELEGKDHKYLYSSRSMTKNYADMVFMLEENDLIKLMSETVRHESKTYPRPTELSFFYGQPFNFNEQQLKEIMSQLSQNEEYSDIRQFKAYNGTDYLYSIKHLTQDYAIALTEWAQYQTP